MGSVLIWLWDRRRHLPGEDGIAIRLDFDIAAVLAREGSNLGLSKREVRFRGEPIAHYLFR